MTSVRVTALAPSTRPSELASPRLVVASASKPREASSRAVPASQGFGITKAPGRSCRARKVAAFSAGVFMASGLLEVDPLVDRQLLQVAAQAVEPHLDRAEAHPV